VVRKIIIKAILVPESASMNPEEIVKEILREFRDGSLIIPWCRKIERIYVTEGK